MRWLQASVDFFTVAYVVNNYGVVGKVQLINDAVIADSAAPGSFCAGKFAIRWDGGFFSQSVKCFKYGISLGSDQANRPKRYSKYTFLALFYSLKPTFLVAKMST